MPSVSGGFGFGFTYPNVYIVTVLLLSWEKKFFFLICGSLDLSSGFFSYFVFIEVVVYFYFSYCMTRFLGPPTPLHRSVSLLMTKGSFFHSETYVHCRTLWNQESSKADITSSPSTGYPLATEIEFCLHVCALCVLSGVASTSPSW